MEANLRITALMPMKGNSERVPNKNLRKFGKNPLYHTMLNTLSKSKYISEIYINTDSEIIAKNVNQHFPDVGIIDRPKELLGDLVSMNKIIEYDLSQLKGDFFLQTHSTNPLLTIETLDSAIEFFFENLEKHDSVFSVTRWQTRLYFEDVSPINHNPKELIRTQDLTPVYEENSNFFIFTKQSFADSGKKRIGVNPGMFPVNKIEALDIDEEEDFLIAEQLYKAKNLYHPTNG